ncbi:unnamed protein product [Amoebophrya sp. A120]|nr:unnamed protein product [Amoebophrya sp. A120]|eukprot:GSA120T00012927001.1
MRRSTKSASGNNADSGSASARAVPQAQQRGTTTTSSSLQHRAPPAPTSTSKKRSHRSSVNATDQFRASHYATSKIHESVKIWGSRNIVIGTDVVIEKNVHLRGDLDAKLVIGNKVRIGENTILRPGTSTSGVLTGTSSASSSSNANWAMNTIGGKSAAAVGVSSRQVESAAVQQAQPVSVGTGTRVGKGCVLIGSRIGERVVIGNNVVISSNCVLGDGCEILADAVVPFGTVVPQLAKFGGAPASLVAAKEQMNSTSTSSTQKRQLPTGAGAKTLVFKKDLDFTSEEETSKMSSPSVVVMPSPTGTGVDLLAQAELHVEPPPYTSPAAAEPRRESPGRGRQLQLTSKVAEAELTTARGREVVSSTGRHVVRKRDGSYELRGQPVHPPRSHSSGGQPRNKRPEVSRGVERKGNKGQSKSSGVIRRSASASNAKVVSAPASKQAQETVLAPSAQKKQDATSKNTALVASRKPKGVFAKLQEKAQQRKKGWATEPAGRTEPVAAAAAAIPAQLAEKAKTAAPSVVKKPAWATGGGPAKETRRSSSDERKKPEQNDVRSMALRHSLEKRPSKEPGLVVPLSERGHDDGNGIGHLTRMSLSSISARSSEHRKSTPRNKPPSLGTVAKPAGAGAANSRSASPTRLAPAAAPATAPAGVDDSSAAIRNDTAQQQHQSPQLSFANLSAIEVTSPGLGNLGADDDHALSPIQLEQSPKIVAPAGKMINAHIKSSPLESFLSEAVAATAARQPEHLHVQNPHHPIPTEHQLAESARSRKRTTRKKRGSTNVAERGSLSDLRKADDEAVLFDEDDPDLSVPDLSVIPELASKIDEVETSAVNTTEKPGEPYSSANPAAALNAELGPPSPLPLAVDDESNKQNADAPEVLVAEQKSKLEEVTLHFAPTPTPAMQSTTVESAQTPALPAAAMNVPTKDDEAATRTSSFAKPKSGPGQRLAALRERLKANRSTGGATHSSILSSSLVGVANDDKTPRSGLELETGSGLEQERNYQEDVEKGSVPEEKNAALLLKSSPQLDDQRIDHAGTATTGTAPYNQEQHHHDQVDETGSLPPNAETKSSVASSGLAFRGFKERLQQLKAEKSKKKPGNYQQTHSTKLAPTTGTTSVPPAGPPGHHESNANQPPRPSLQTRRPSASGLLRTRPSGAAGEVGSSRYRTTTATRPASSTAAPPNAANKPVLAGILKRHPSPLERATSSSANKTIGLAGQNAPGVAVTPLAEALRALEDALSAHPTSEIKPPHLVETRSGSQPQTRGTATKASADQIADLIDKAKQLGASGSQLQKAERRKAQLLEDAAKVALFAATSTEDNAEFQNAVEKAREAGVHPLTIQRASRERTRTLQEKRAEREKQAKHQASKSRCAELVSQLEDLVTNVDISKPLPTAQVEFLLTQLQQLAPTNNASGSSSSSASSSSQPGGSSRRPSAAGSAGTVLGSSSGTSSASRTTKRTSLESACRDKGMEFRKRIQGLQDAQAQLDELWETTRDTTLLENALERAKTVAKADTRVGEERLAELRRVLQKEADLLAQATAIYAPNSGYQGSTKDPELQALCKTAMEFHCSPLSVLSIFEHLRGLEKILSHLPTILDYARGMNSCVSATRNFFQHHNLYALRFLPAVTRLLSKHIGLLEDHSSANTTSAPPDVLRQAHAVRRRLHNEIQDLKGAVRVYARIRPMSQREKLAQRSPLTNGNNSALAKKDQSTDEGLQFSQSDVTIGTSTSDVRRHREAETFEFDSVFGPSSTQTDIFEECADLVQSALDGYNVCIFTYGQTGAGKTYTLLGSGAVTEKSSTSKGGAATWSNGTMTGGTGVQNGITTTEPTSSSSTSGHATRMPSTSPRRVGVAESGSFNPPARTTVAAGTISGGLANNSAKNTPRSSISAGGEVTGKKPTALNRDAGVAPRTINHIFNLLEQNQRYATRQVFVTMCELHNTKLRDLLVDHDFVPELRPGGSGELRRSLSARSALGTTSSAAETAAANNDQEPTRGRLSTQNVSRLRRRSSSNGGAAQQQNLNHSRGSSPAHSRAGSVTGAAAAPAGASGDSFSSFLASRTASTANDVGKLQQDSNLVVKLSPRSGQVRVPGATERRVKSREELLEILNLGVKLRKTAATAVNSTSSRSHLVLSVHFRDSSEENSRFSGKSSKITFCDLAGSERLKKTGATGAAMREAVEINKSLSALGDVLQAIVAGQKMLQTQHSTATLSSVDSQEQITVGGEQREILSSTTGELQQNGGGNSFTIPIPYRNHKLTQLMQDSLGGSAKTLMFVNLSPCSTMLDESLMSLRFAARARQVKQKR